MSAGIRQSINDLEEANRTYLETIKPWRQTQIIKWSGLGILYVPGSYALSMEKAKTYSGQIVNENNYLNDRKWIWKPD